MLPKTPPLKYRVATLFRNSFNAFKVSLYDTITYQVLFAILLNIVILPILYLIYDFLFDIKGYPTLLNTDIVSFLFSLRGIIAVLLFAFVTIAIYCIEQFGLLFITASYQTGERMTAVSALRQSAKQLPVELAVVAKKALYYVAVLAIFLALAVINFLFRDSWFFIPLLILSALLCIFSLYSLYIRWIFVDYFVVLEGKKVSDAFAYTLNRKLSLELIVTVLAWFLLIWLCSTVIIIVFSALSWLSLYIVVDNHVLLAPIFSILVAIFSLIVVILSLVAKSLTSNLFTELYYQNKARERTDSEIIVPEQKELCFSSTPEMRKKQIHAALGICLVGIAIATFFLIPVVQDDIDSIDKTVYVTAHRGSSCRAPQNTISAFVAAIEDKADYVELDVQETRDVVVAVLHDANLHHVGGVDANIWELNYSELQEIDVGSSFSPEFAGERVPTLEKVIDVTKGKVKLNIEIKIYGHQKHLEENTVRIVEEKGIEDECVITSLDYNALKEVRALNPDLRIGMIIAAVIGDYSKLDVDFYSVEPNLVLTKKFMRDAHDDNKEVHIWTLNPKADVSEYLDLGVDNIINDYPVMVHELLNEKQNRSEIEKLITKFFTFIEIPGFL
jgi:glycerophosphoryl diester phosphodiesterase